jgi:DNA helicase-2/ATP-dependent DNA helicase PcrA
LIENAYSVRFALESEVRYMLVDEYRDTNYVQEQILLKLTEQTGDLCVVGDEDQSLDRFRGATVHNVSLLDFGEMIHELT